ncbi:MAG: peptidylprolyl isomerase [Muribaculaceae bacterium]|nr:peptidylprolyl isomerase [Muribaculaceae bacterium]
MEKIEPGKYIELVYDLYKVNPDGTEELVHQTDEKEPEAIVFGVTHGLVVPLAQDIEGKEQGYEYDVTATPDQAFGERSDEYIVELEKEVFEVEGKFDAEMVKVGNALPMMTADGMRIIGKVLEVGPKMVKMDFNHPLAGCTVRFKGKVQTVREATPEEIKFVTGEGGCGCGCDHNGCDDGCQGGGCNGCH